jgi:hypothetical protein
LPWPGLCKTDPSSPSPAHAGQQTITGARGSSRAQHIHSPQSLNDVNSPVNAKSSQNRLSW